MSPPPGGAETERSSLASLQAAVAAGCPGRAVDIPALGSLATVLDNMATNERFVATVREALLDADAYASGVVTVSATAIDVALAEAGLTAAARAGGLRPHDAGGGAADVGDDRRPDQRRQRQHGPPRDRRRLPGHRRGARRRATVELAARRRPVPSGPGGPRSSTSGLAVDPGHVTATLADGNIVGFVEIAGRLVAPGVPTARVDPRRRRRWVLRIDVDRHWQFDATGRLTGWRVGVARVAVRRDDRGRIVGLDER